jgi:hypothetical protein
MLTREENETLTESVEARRVENCCAATGSLWPPLVN